MKKKYLIYTAFLSVIIFLLMYFKIYEASKSVDGFLNTHSTVTVIGRKNVNGVIDECIDIIKLYDEMFSISNPESDVHKINNSDDGVKVSYETLEIIEMCSVFSEDTNGKFDITVGKFSDLWNEAIKTGEKPDDNAISELLPLGGDLIIDKENNSVKRTAGNQKLNLGAAAKGYISDKLFESLENSDVHGAMINLGGNVLAYGRKKDNSLWNVGISDPRDESGIIGSVKVLDKFVITSGDYERFTEIDGERFHHIIDAKTGYPSKSGIIGVTVICDNGLLGDCLSTSCFLTGLEKGKELIEKYNACAIFVTDGGKIYYSKTLEDSFDKTNQSYEYIAF